MKNSVKAIPDTAKREKKSQYDDIWHASVTQLLMELRQSAGSGIKMQTKSYLCANGSGFYLLKYSLLGNMFRARRESCEP
jgi:hypothetical protein